MAFLVPDFDHSDRKKLKFGLSNNTEFEVTFRIGNRRFTLQPGQSKRVTADASTCIEAQPGIIGIEKGFLAGGVKEECCLKCDVEKTESESPTLIISET